MEVKVQSVGRSRRWSTGSDVGCSSCGMNAHGFKIVSFYFFRTPAGRAQASCLQTHPLLAPMVLVEQQLAPTEAKPRRCFFLLWVEDGRKISKSLQDGFLFHWPNGQDMLSV